MSKKERPWGSYFKLYQMNGVWVKAVEVNPGERISLQFHEHRSETWVVAKGDGVVTVNNYTFPVTRGSIVDIPCKAIHRIENVGKSILVFIETACGDNLTEEDIKRLDDDYERE